MKRQQLCNVWVDGSSFAGYHIDNATLTSVVLRFSNRDRILRFNDYITCCARLRSAFETMRTGDSYGGAKVTFYIPLICFALNFRVRNCHFSYPLFFSFSTSCSTCKVFLTRETKRILSTQCFATKVPLLEIMEVTNFLLSN